MPRQQQIHQTLPPEPAKTTADSWLVTTLKNQSVAIVMAAIFALYTFVWNSHDSERDLSFRLSAAEKNIEKLAVADKEQIDTQNNFLIGLTKISEAQSRMAQDIKDVQTQQQKNTEMIFNRK